MAKDRREYQRQYRARRAAEDPTFWADRQRAWREKNPEKAAEYTRRYREKNPDKRGEDYRVLKTKVIDAYGGKCVCCGVDQWQFLTIDHTADDGADHREMLGDRRSASGSTTYRWLREQGFPQKGFQLLCHNCNAAKRHGVCPHLSESIP